MHLNGINERGKQSSPPEGLVPTRLFRSGRSRAEEEERKEGQATEVDKKKGEPNWTVVTNECLQISCEEKLSIGTGFYDVIRHRNRESRERKGAKLWSIDVYTDTRGSSHSFFNPLTLDTFTPNLTQPTSCDGYGK